MAACRAIKFHEDSRNQLLTKIEHHARQETDTMRFAVLAFILVCLVSPQVHAGAWLREEGKGFAATTIQTTADNATSSTIYIEYGITPRITAGIDATYDSDFINFYSSDFFAEDTETFPDGSGIFFLRFPIGSTDRTNKWAYHVGLGARYLDGVLYRAFEVGLSWGRGIQIGTRYGWVNVDFSYNDAPSPAEERVKLDGTVGLGVGDRSKVMLQIFNTFEGGDTLTKIAPSYLYTMKNGVTTFQIGSEIPTENNGDPTLKLGLWYEF
ncbi:MAG: hypothetical protein AAF665_17725 [Pseudomonadota bacterium]